MRGKQNKSKGSKIKWKTSPRKKKKQTKRGKYQKTDNRIRGSIQKIQHQNDKCSKDRTERRAETYYGGLCM